MNKLALTAALLPMMALGLTGCVEDTQPRLQDPVEGSFSLYTPALDNYTYYLTPEGTLTLTTSGQPDYGVATPTQYQVEVSLTDTWTDAEDPENPGVMIPDTYYVLQTVETQSIITVKDRELSAGMCKLMGINEEEDKDLFSDQAIPVYVRVAAYVADPSQESGYVPGSKIYSNSVKISSVKPYFVVPKPGQLYIIGDYQGWDIAGNDKTVWLTETGIGTGIYEGYVNMTTGQASSGFRFYTEVAKDGWGKDGQLPSVGARANDGDNEEVTLDDDAYSGTCTAGKGNWSIKEYPGGWMKIVVNMKDWTISITYEPDYTPEV